MNKTLIVICGLDDFFNKEVALLLSQKLDMFFLDLKELVSFELSEKESIIEKCGIDYYYNLEKKTIKNASTFENTIILSNYDLISYRQNYLFFKPVATTFYLKFSKNYLQSSANIDTINLMAFPQRDKSLKDICNFTINLTNNNIKQAVEKVVLKLKEVYF